MPSGKPEYEAARRSFSWASVVQALGWDEGAGINLGHTLVDRHADSHKVALYWVGREGQRSVWTYRDLKRLSNRVANLLRAMGVGKGDRVAGLLSRRPETVAIMVAAWKAGAIYVPIFTAFAPEAVRLRLQSSEAKAVFVHHEHRGRVPGGEQLSVVTIGGERGLGIERGDTSFWQAVEAQPDSFEAEPCRRADPAVILYTSGSTGEPKGIQVAGNFIAALQPYLRYGVDLQPSDMYWPTGDPGWGYGIGCYYAAMAMGIPVLSYEGAPTPEACLRLLQEHRVTSLATVPTVLRGIMALGAGKIAEYRLALRCVSCAGEPLNSEVVRFFRENLGVTPADHFGASEIGMPLGNFNALDVEILPGSMGRPMPGFELAVLDEHGRELPRGQVGQLALRQSEQGYYALGYWKGAAPARALYRDGWFTGGDLAKQDAAGYFWFEGRADDLIKSSGYRIGPFEVESAILHHPAVAEAAVVGKPDPVKGQIVKAYVVLKPGQSGTPDLAREIQDTARRRLASYAYPRELDFVHDLPKNDSGKIQRFKLRPAS